MNASKKRGAGRPRKILNRETIVRLTAKGAPLQYLAAYLGVSEDTLSRNYADAIEAGRALRDGSLQMRQFKSAQSGSTAMLKWLGQQWLGQREKSEVQTSTLLSEWTAEMKADHERMKANAQSDELRETP